MKEGEIWGNGKEKVEVPTSQGNQIVETKVGRNRKLGYKEIEKKTRERKRLQIQTMDLGSVRLHRKIFPLQWEFSFHSSPVYLPIAVPFNRKIYLFIYLFYK